MATRVLASEMLPRSTFGPVDCDSTNSASQTKPGRPRKVTREDHCDAIFGSTQQVIQTAGTLLRLLKLDEALPRRIRAKATDDLTKLWTEGSQKASLIPPTANEAELEKLKDSMSLELERLGPRVSTIYGPELRAARTASELDKCARRFFKDTKSILISPLNKSARGLKGPTYLVSYPRLDEQLQNPRLHHYVMKWTHWSEICSNRLYGCFSQNFSEHGHPSTFVVPKASALDFDKKVHEKPNGTHVILSAAEVSQLREKFLGVVKAVNPKLTPEDSQIMMLERIPGSNLFDFAKTKWKDLTPVQKEKIFTRLGRLALLDVVMGNLDRFIQVYYTKASGTFNLETFESNLGNAMIVWSGDSNEFPELYAIDNGIQSELIHDSSQRAAYCAFLRTMLAEPKMEELFADAMIQSMLSAVDRMAEEEDVEDIEEVRALQEQLNPIKRDLKTIAKPAISRGIAEMTQRLHTTLLPSWDSEQTIPLKQYLSWAYPELLEAITERFETFKSIRR